jgi:RNA polymerase sigma factor (sigma-70 family)
MSNWQAYTLLRQLRQHLEPSAVKAQSDAELLGRFIGLRDEEAFAALVHRHGRLVWHVCRHILGRDHDAEDAFQATFLVLARKARSIRKRKSVASWLHGVAYRIARKARVAAARRRKHESQAAPVATVSSSSELAWRDLQAILDEELNRLPEKFHAPFVLCCLEGQSKPEAARALGWKEGTVSSRLAHARKLLQRRLARRGVSLSAVLCGMALARDAAAALVPSILIAATVKASVAFVAGQGLASGQTGAAALADTLLRGMAATRLKITVVLVLMLSLIGTSAVAIVREIATDDRPVVDMPVAHVARKEPEPVEVRAEPAAAAPAAERGKDAAADRTFAGQVLDKEGRPCPGARVAVMAFPNVPIGELRGSQPRRVLGATQVDAQGRFTLLVPAATAAAHFGFSFVATRPGKGLSWQLMTSDASRQDLELRLEPSRTIRGRLIDSEGRPAAGVEVRLAGLAKENPRPTSVQLPAPSKGDTGLPAPVVTGAGGEFEIQGVSAGHDVHLLIRDDRFAPQWLVLKRQTGDATDVATLRLAPRRTLEGTVICRETGQPLEGVEVSASSSSELAGSLPCQEVVQTDAHGRFRLHPFPGSDVGLLIYPPAGMPYLVGQHHFKWPDTLAHSVKVTLKRGVLLQGQVTEEGSGKPVSRATIRFHPRTVGHPLIFGQVRSETSIAWWLASATSGPDGRFRLAALPGPGHLLVKGLDPGYLHVETTTGLLESGQPGGSLRYPDAMVPLELAPGSGPLEVPITVRRGVTVKGRMLSADGQPARVAVILCPTYAPGGDFNYIGEALYGEHGRFEVPGCDPNRPVPVLFYNPLLRQGARVELAGEDEPTVRLVPCRTAVVRFVDETGTPASGVPIQLDVVVHPGGARLDETWHRLHSGYTVPASTLAAGPYAKSGPRPGEVTFTGLVPGATYVIQANEGQGMVVKGEFLVKENEDPQVPDIVVHRPDPRPSAPPDKALKSPSPPQ